MIAYSWIPLQWWVPQAFAVLAIAISLYVYFQYIEGWMLKMFRNKKKTKEYSQHNKVIWG